MERVSLHRRVETCHPGKFDECIKKSAFSLGVSNHSGAVRVRILLRTRELAASQLYEAHTNTLNAFMKLKNYPTYQWEVQPDPMSDLVDLTQGELPL